jgi:DNA-binding NtrC family response regulator
MFADPWVVIDATMVALHRMASAVARGTGSVLICGETGVGKEIFAEAIHRRSGRTGRLVRLNCAALAPGLVESELFGHQAGAFTGAMRTTPGLLETGDGGTVFLDEVGEIPPAMQAKLLRVVEDGAVTPVGGRHPRQVALRFVCATNRDLGDEIRGGAFRLDLYYRLSGTVLRIPPLRDRRCEIEPLARHFLQQAAGTAAAPRLSVAALDQLLRHPWPGNVRELKNAIGNALLLCDGGEIRPEHLWGAAEIPTLGRPLGRPELLQVTGGGGRPAGEREQIVRALDLCAGNQTRAARLLGVSRATLIRRLSIHRFSRPRSTA